MRVALIGPVYPYRGGIAHYTASLAEAFQQEGHEVIVFSFSKQYPNWLYPGRSDKDPSPHKFQLPTIYIIDTLNPWSWAKTATLIASYKPDLVIFQWWTTFMAPAFAVIGLLCKRHGFSLLFLIHNVYPHEKHWFDPWLVRTTLRLGDVFIVQSLQEKNRLLHLFPNARVFYHPHPIYLPFTEQNKIDKNEAKVRLGLNPNLPVVLFFGIVRPYKGLSLLLESVAALKQRGQIIQLLVAGEFWDDIQKYRNLIGQLGISGLVRLENRYIPNEDIPVYFSAADVFVAPYTAGTQSGAVKLAMGYGLPIVASEIIADELIESYPKAKIVNVAHHQHLTESLVNFLQTERQKEDDGIIPSIHERCWKNLTDLIVKINTDQISALDPNQKSLSDCNIE